MPFAHDSLMPIHHHAHPALCDDTIVGSVRIVNIGVLVVVWMSAKVTAILLDTDAIYSRSESNTSHLRMSKG